jgi:hypothetical protein
VSDPPIAYFVTERRGGKWLLGDDWTHYCDTLADAEEVAEQWRAMDHHRHNPAGVGVFAVTMVEPAVQPCP